MTWDERVEALQSFDRGWSHRQAGFVATVMLHAGVCLQRHYEVFAEVPHGVNVQTFFRGLVARGMATTRPCGHNRARIYHIHSKPLYRAIGETNNRHRKPTSLSRAVERLMLLDAVLLDRDRRWLATEADKLAYFTLTHRIERRDLPSLTWRALDAETTRYFPDKLPIGLDADRRTHVFLFLVTRESPIEFRAFLERHAALLRILPAWTVRLLVPRHKTSAIPMHERAFREHLLAPLRPMVVDDLRWYFQARQAVPDGANERFDQAARAFAAPRFSAMYRAWKDRGNTVLEGALSHLLADAVARQSGRLETYVLPHGYLRLLPLVGTA